MHWRGRDHMWLDLQLPMQSVMRVGDLQQLGGFLQFPPIKLTGTI